MCLVSTRTHANRLKKLLTLISANYLKKTSDDYRKEVKPEGNFEKIARFN